LAVEALDNFTKTLKAQKLEHNTASAAQFSLRFCLDGKCNAAFDELTGLQ